MTQDLAGELQRRAAKRQAKDATYVKQPKVYKESLHPRDSRGHFAASASVHEEKDDDDDDEFQPPPEAK